MLGAEVVLAANGAEAFDRATVGGNTIDVILMDIHMPCVDGLEATRRLRTHGFRNPILAVTALASRDDRLRALAAGCDDHLGKPLDLLALPRRIKTFIRSPGDAQ